MTSISHHFLTLAYNNAWANHRLLKACSDLNQEDFDARRTSFFPSIKATLNHILIVDRYYLDALERSMRSEPPNYDAWKIFETEKPFDTCTEIRCEQHKADRRLIAICKLLTDELVDRPVNVPRPDGIKIEQMSRLLTHLLQHQIHHRGQVHAMLSGTLVKPPQLDEFFCSDEANLRKGDFQELGFSEREIWGCQ